MYISIHEIISRHKADIKGILHLGAHLGEEAKDYHDARIDRVIWVEGNPSLVSQLKENVAAYPENQVFNLLVSDRDNASVNFNVTEFSQSSSILDLGITKEIHGTNIIEKIPLTAHRIDSFFRDKQLDITGYNFVNIDLQGYELIALQSMGTLLNKIDWVYTEVNVKSLYKNCALLYQVDSFLLNKGFVRVQTYMTTHFWGDALYVRKNITGFDKRIKLLKIYNEEGGRRIGFIVSNIYQKSKVLVKRGVKKILRYK
jgi:FkbM family methyltransferase